MQFLNPAMLMTLGLIPVLILIHALKPKPRPVEVTTLFLWQAILSERSGHLRLRQFKRNLPLLFQILIVVLTALALARPTGLFSASQKGDMILVIDTSASMKTKTGSGTRFDLARKSAFDLIDQRDDKQKILIVEAGSKPMIRDGFLENSKRAKRLLKGIQPTDAPGKLAKAIYLALSFVDSTEADDIYVLTDGADTDFTNLTQIHPRIVPIIVAGGERNIGITKFEFRQELDRHDHYEMMLEVKNFNPDPLECPIRLSVDKTNIIDARLTFGAQEKKLLIFPYSGLITGIAEANLEIDDDLAVDNSAYLSLNRSKDIWVLLVSKGNYFLEKLLQAYPNFMVNRVTDIIPSSWKEQTTRHDLVIIDRMDFPLTAKGNFLLIDSYSPSLPVVRKGQIDFPNVLDWDSKSPLMANVNVAGLTIEKATRLEVDTLLRPVMESSQSGLMFTYEENGLRAVLFGFDITRSDLPLKVAFPVMMSNIINWLNPRKLSFSTLQTRAGEPFAIYLNPETRHFLTRAPQGKWEKHAVTTNPYRYTRTQKAGIYTISENDKDRYFTVNLVDESESDIRNSPAVKTSDASDTGHATDETRVPHPLWSFFLVLGLVLMMLEWYFWLNP
jgi:hypothetical protein